MALQKATNFKGLSAPSAYFEVVELRSSKPGGLVTVAVLVHTDATKTNQLELCIFDFAYTADMTVGQAYIQLKTLDAFAGAIDV